ncbi:MAG: NAD kinase [Chromatiales bacterium]|jgi:NAD+ kinase|nr:NAD kinase [Chromatiales bacterium]
MDPEKIAFAASYSDSAQSALKELTDYYGETKIEDAEIIVALGGDGFMLETLHRTMSRSVPIYGMNQGTVGFLMNEYRLEDLPERVATAHTNEIHPLRMQVVQRAGTTQDALAINEVSLHRQTGQASKVRISVDGKVRVPEVICDGVLVATPAGSTAYNLSAHGPILPLNAGILALTPISPFRPRRWRGALLPNEATLHFEILEPFKRPVSATADASEVRDVAEVTVSEARDITLRLLFDAEHALEERILNEQFAI